VLRPVYNIKVAAWVPIEIFPGRGKG